MWRKNANGTVEYETGTGADTWQPVTTAVAIDAGNNVLASVPASLHADLEDRFADRIKRGEVNVVGV